MISFDILFILLILMIIGALIAVETTNLLSAVICVGAVGFLVTIAFMILSAPDVAIAQIVVEILCLVILIRATIKRGLKTVSEDRKFAGAITRVVIVAVLAVVLAVFGAGMFAKFPPFGTPVMKRVSDAPSATYVREGLQKTGAPNAVTAILLDFRAYDTLGEATVLFCAILGALAILRKTARGGFDAVLIVDTADFGGTPGEMRIFDIEAVAGGSLSTHAISLRATADYLKARCSARIVFLAFQGQTMDLGEGPGKAVSEAVDLLAETLSKLRLKCTNPAAGQPTL